MCLFESFQCFLLVAPPPFFSTHSDCVLDAFFHFPNAY